MSIPAPVRSFLEWLDSENIKPGVTPERQAHIAQTMCDLCNRQLLFTDKDSKESVLSMTEMKCVADRILVQQLLRHTEIVGALIETLTYAKAIYAERHDSPEEFAHGVVWFIKDYVTVRLLSAMWKQVSGDEYTEPDWHNLIFEVFASVLPPKKKKPAQRPPHSLKVIRARAFPAGSLKMGYRIHVDDNSEFFKFNVRWWLGEFTTYEAAERAAQQLVEISVFHASNMGESTPVGIFEGYSIFGDDPVIEPFGGADEPQTRFSAWRYAGRIIKEHASSKEVPAGANSNAQGSLISPT